MRGSASGYNNGVIRDSSYSELIVERRDAHSLLIQFNRPTVKNALRRRTVYELLRALEAGINDAAITVIVLTGSGDVFTAGNDLAQMTSLGGDEMAGSGNDALDVYCRSANFVLRSLVRKMLYCKKVLVALVNGDCVGIGFTLCALCDVVYCTESAYFWAPFTQLGICMEACASVTFPLILGRAKASEVLLFGVRLSTADAMAHHFVAAMLSLKEVDTVFWPRMQEYARLPAPSLLAGKRLLWQTVRPQLLDALQLECNELSELRRSEVFLSKITAFAKGRQKRSHL